MGNPNCCFMIIAVTFFLSRQSPRGTVKYILAVLILDYFALWLSYQVDSSKVEGSCTYLHTYLFLYTICQWQNVMELYLKDNYLSFLDRIQSSPSTLNIDLLLWHTQLIVCAENIKSRFKSWVFHFTFQAYTMPHTLNCMYVSLFKFHIWILRQF